MMIQHAPGLSARALHALAALEQRTIAVDGGRLKLEWGELRARSGERVEDLLCWEADRLVGFLGLYAFAAPNVELAGMVDPAWRRRGIATALLEAARPICRERGFAKTLLVTPRDSAGGRAIARRHGAVLDHSEHALVLRGAPHAGVVPGVGQPDLTLRTATRDDVPALSRLLDEAFDAAPADVQARFETDTARTLLVELGGLAVGTVRVTQIESTGGIYGFAVEAARRGQGIGREVLRRVCDQLYGEGASSIGLEVAVENEHALGLYTSVGFERVTTEDYYALPW